MLGFGPGRFEKVVGEGGHHGEGAFFDREIVGREADHAWEKD